MSQRRARAALGGAALARRAPAPRRGRRAASAASSRSKPVAEGAEADDDQPRVGHAREHERPGGGEQVDALGDDELADEGDVAVARRRSSAPARGPPRPRRGRTSRASLAVRHRLQARRRAPRSAAPRLVALARAELLDVDAGRAEARARAAAPGRSIAAHRLRRCAASRRGRRCARSQALAGVRAGSASGSRLTTYSSALPWILTA